MLRRSRVQGCLSSDRHQRGVTLIEMLIAVGISSLIGLGVAGLTSLSLSYFIRVTEQYRTLQSLGNASYALKAVFSQAMELTTDGAAVTDAAAGRVLQPANADFTGAPPSAASTANVHRIAAFQREIGLGPVSTPRVTGVWFQEPVANGTATHHSGILYIDYGSTSEGALNTTADTATFFDRLTEFQLVSLDPGTLTVGDRVRALEIRLVGRYFTDSDKTNWRWCPAAQMGVDADCPVLSGFQDVTRTIKVSLRNNRLTTPGGANDDRGTRLFGGLYFFRPINFMTVVRP